jgi:uncharacterized protein
LVGTAQVVINGKLVQMAGSMIGPVSETILAQFAQNFSNAAAAVPVTVAATVSPVAEATNEVPAAHVEPVAPPESDRSEPARVEPVRELNALAVLWSVLRNWFATVFGRRI